MVRSILAASALLSLAGLVAAQTGYGRFPCTIVNGDGTFSPDPSQCLNDNLVNPGASDNTLETQGDRVNPVDPVCTQQLETGAYFCGIAGATCTSTSGCDNGVCVNGICQGGLTQGCGGVDSNCSGFLYCNSGDFQTTPSQTCGGLGSFCQDNTQGDISGPAEDNYRIFNMFCSSGYCNYGSGNCDSHGTTIGAECSSDPEFYCTETSTGQALTCNTSTFTCQLAAVPSGRARERRNASKRSLCPASHEACSVAGSSSFECMDLSSSLENCGSCGNDCTAMTGVDAVGCVSSVCEIWSCAEGYTWSEETQSCSA